MTKILNRESPQPFPMESQTIEYKETFTDKIKKEIAGFLNGDETAYIYLGVDDDTRKVIRSFSGEERHSYEEKISNWASTAFYPSAVSLVNVHTDNEPFCIEVTPGNLTPYQLKKKSSLFTYVRNNSLTEPASAESIKKLINKSSLDSFDEQSSDIQQLSFDYLKKEFNKIHKDFDPKNLSGFLNKDKKYSNTALLLSEENLYTSTVAIFGSEKTLGSLIDSRRFKGSIFEQIDKILEYIDLNNHNRTEITGDPQRKERRDFPPVAIREGLINAFAHRSYIDMGVVQVKIYSDRIEILSPGPLPGGLTVKDVLAGRNYPRNHNVVYALRFLKYVEDLGTGIDRIEVSYEAGETNKQPKLEAGENFVKLVLPNQNYITAPSNINVVSTNDSNSIEVVVDDDGKIIDFLKEHQTIRRKDVENIFSIKGSQANQKLKKLVDKKVLKKIGSGPKTSYRLNRKILNK